MSTEFSSNLVGRLTENKSFSPRARMKSGDCVWLDNNNVRFLQSRCGRKARFNLSNARRREKFEALDQKCAFSKRKRAVTRPP